MTGYRTFSNERNPALDNSKTGGNITEQTGVNGERAQGQQIGPYSNCTHHATGLVSTVYRTRCLKNSNTFLALKITNPSTEQQPHNSRREARILSKCSHQYIISLYATHTLPKSNAFVLVFPFQPFELATRLRSPEALPKAVLHNMFSALAYLHVNNILHRDLKPSNILLASPNGPAYLADFGIAWHVSDRASEPPHEKISDIGTTCYRAPELLFGCHNYGTGVDLWAAGCVAAETLMHGKHGIKGVDEWTLFDAGELGSELALVKSIFEILGTPNEKTWPETKDLADWGKMSFIDFPPRSWTDILPGVQEKGRQLVSSLVKYQSTERVRAADVSPPFTILNISRIAQMFFAESAI